jgi:hypothetical protein
MALVVKNIDDANRQKEALKAEQQQEQQGPQPPQLQEVEAAPNPALPLA